MKVDYFIKNKFSEQDFETSVYDWLSDGDYTPDDIIENIITEHNLLYLPTHLYKCIYDGNVSASLGYVREEVYYTYNPNTKRNERMTREVTDWVPHSQSVNGDVDAIIYAGETRFDFMKSFIQSTYWSSDDLTKLSTEAGEDQKALNKYKINRSDAWGELGFNECHRKASNEIIKNLPSGLVRNFRANLNFKINNQISVVIPFWVFMYQYQGKNYYVSVDGNNPERISGIKPENKKRKYTVWAIRWIGWVLTIYLSWIGANKFNEEYADLEYIDLISIGVFMVLFGVLGFIVERIIKNIKTESKQRRQEKLAKMREAKRLT